MYTVDRFEGEMAVLETANRKTLNIPRYLLPPEAKEGDILNEDYAVDIAETERRKRKAQDLLRDFFDE